MHDERPVWAPPSWVVPQLRDALPHDWGLVEVTSRVSGRGDGSGLTTEALNAVRGAEVYFGLGLPRELLRAALEPPARLRWIHSGAAGVASLLHPELVERDVVLTNSAGIHAPAMAETVLGMILHFFRGLDHAVRAQHARAWRVDIYEALDSGVREVGGATLGIIGYGGIGRALAQRARALGMHILATRRTPRPDDGPEVLHGDDASERLLRESDVVAICVPSTSDTRGMIGAAQLAQMKQDAILINVGRGDVVDEDALVRALQQGRLRGAALDVFAQEPLPPDSPLWTLNNVLITPHVSATSPRYWEREMELMLFNLRAYLAGEPLHNRVDIAAGY